MSERALRWYLAFSVAFFVGVAAVLVVRVTVVRGENVRRAESDLETLAAALADGWNRTEDLPDALERAKANHTVRAISVFRTNTGLDYLWARSSAYLSPGTAPGDGLLPGTPAFTIDQLTEIELSRATAIDGEPHVVAAVYRVLDRSATFPLLRDSLVALLSFALLTVVVAIVSLAGTQTAQGTDRVKDDGGRTALPSDKTAAGCVDGVSAETSLPRKLTLELERSAFNEQDFSVAVLEFSGLSRRENDFSAATDSVLDFFTFEDMIFAFGENQLVVLFPGSGLADTLSSLERYQRHFWQQRSAWDGGGEVELFAGASSRNGRLVDGPRILHESEAALRESYESSGHIVGFDPDPDRFRSFLTAEV